MPTNEQTIYEAAGGAEAFQSLVNEFYNLVVENPILRPLFPADLTEVRQRQYWFLSQFFGGPALYAAHRGAPKLRYRHLPFPITEKHAEAWLDCMNQALERTIPNTELRKFMLNQLARTAVHMVNTPEEGD